MKSVLLEDIKLEYNGGPYTNIIDPSKIEEEDPRAANCADLALLNLKILHSKRFEKKPQISDYEQLVFIQKHLVKTKSGAVLPEDFVVFVDKYFFNFSTAFLNPNRMNGKEFLEILLQALSGGYPVVAATEIPNSSSVEPMHLTNHVSIVHSEGGHVYQNGHEIDLEYLIRSLYFSKNNFIAIYYWR